MLYICIYFTNIAHTSYIHVFLTIYLNGKFIDKKEVLYVEIVNATT